MTPTFDEGKPLQNVKREIAGHVGVDVARIMICDPSYIEHQNLAERDDEIYMGHLDAMSHGEGFPMHYQIPFTPLGHEGAAVVVHSGLGDGFYPVYVTTADIEGYGHRVVRVEVDFLDHLWLQTIPLEMPDATMNLLRDLKAWLGSIEDLDKPEEVARLVDRIERIQAAYEADEDANDSGA